MMTPELREVIMAAVERKGAHGIDLVVRGDRGRQVIEVFIDTEQGVTTALCAEVSREVSAAIDQANLLTGPYRLDVSSPGIDRPLRFPWQYRKHTGRRVQVKYRNGDQVQTIDGTLISVGEAAVAVRTKSMSEPIEIPFENILESRIPAPW
jgi:ribosome maturation factor RimP